MNLVHHPGPPQTWLLSALRSWTLGSRFPSSRGANSQTQTPSPLSLWDLEYSSYILVIPYITLNLLLCLPTYYLLISSERHHYHHYPYTHSPSLCECGPRRE